MQKNQHQKHLTVLDVENLAKVFGVNAKMYQNCQNPEDKIIFPVSLVKN